jgi:hypothetical protein
MWLQFETSAINQALGLRERILREVHRYRFGITDEFTTPAGRAVVSKIVWLNCWVRRGATRSVPFAVRRPFDRDESYLYLNVPRIQLVQAVEISISTIDQLKAAGTDPPSVIQTFEVHVVFDLDIGQTSTDPYLLLSVSGVERLPSVAPVQAFASRIQAMFPAVRTPIDVGELSGLGGNPVVANVGLAFVGSPGPLSADNPREAVGRCFVVMRIEVGAPPNTNDWEGFFSNPAAARFAASGRNGFVAGDRSWAFFTHQGFVTDAASSKVWDALKGSTAFRLQGGVSSTWAAPDRRCLLSVEFYGTVLADCDIDVRVQVNAEMSVMGPSSSLVYEPGTLREHAKVNSWKDDWDTAACAFLMTAAWPYVGVKLMEVGGVSEIGYALGLLIPGVAVGLSLGFLNKGGMAPSPGATCVRPDPDKDEFDCTLPMPFGSGLLGPTLRLHDSFGRPDGLVFLGDVFWHRRLACPTRLNGVNAPPLKLDTPHYSCGVGTASGLAAIETNPGSYATYHARIDLDFDRVPLPADNSTAPVSVNFNDVLQPYVFLARVRPEDDPLGVFGRWLKVDDGGVDVEIPVVAVPAAYFNHPYSCPVLIQTSDGSRLVTLPPIVQATADEVQRITRGAWVDTVSNCYAKSQAYNPRWEIDPASRFERHHWEVVVGGLQPGETVSLDRAVGRSVAVARADRSGSARLRALLLPDEYAGELSFVRSGGAPPSRGDRSPEELVAEGFVSIDTRQLQLLLVAEVAVDAAGPVAAAVPLRVGDRQGLAVLAGGELVAYRPHHEEFSQELGRLQVPGYEGLLGLDDEAALWGRAGLAVARVDLDGAVVTLEVVSDEPVLAMADAGRTAYVLRQGRIEAWDRDGAAEPVLEAVEATTLAASPSAVVVGWRDRVVAYTQEGRRLQPRSEWAADGVRRVAAATALGGDSHFLVHADRTTLIDVSGDDGITAQAEYGTADVPLLASCVRDGDRLVEVPREADRVRIYEPGGRALV